MKGNATVTDPPVVMVTRQGLVLRNPTSGWPFAVSAFVCACAASIGSLESWRSATDTRALLLTLLLACAAAVGCGLSILVHPNQLLNPPLQVYVVCAAVLVGPMAAITVGAVAAATSLISPPQAQLFNGSLGAIQGAATAAVAAQFAPLGTSEHVLAVCAAAAGAAALTWSGGQGVMYVARDLPLRRLPNVEVPTTGSDFVVAVGVSPAIILLYRYAGFLPTALLLGVMLGAFAVFRSYRKRLIDLNAQIELLSRTDPLTGAVNRRAFTERLEQECSRSARNGRPFALLLFDLDNFKELNDSHGHVAADQVLSELTVRVRTRLRVDDMIARIGGDEFAVIANDPTDESTLKTLAALINKAAREPFNPSQEPIRASVSIGAIVTDGSLAPQQLLQHADTALYEAKRSGRNRFKLVTQHE